MISRRKLLFSSALSMAAGLAGTVHPRRLLAASRSGQGVGQNTPVVTPNGSALPWRLEDGRKTFHLIAEPVVREFAPGLKVNCWGYNGQTPGPTIEAVEGDRVRLLVENRLPEPTSVHWQRKDPG